MTAAGQPIEWLGSREAADRLGVTLRTLYRFIDEGDLVAYKFGRVIRVQSADIDRFIEVNRIEPGTLRHLYPAVKSNLATEPEGSSDQAAAGDD